jgi:hypothetical protein
VTRPGFDRVRPRTATAASVSTVRRDTEGKRALFSPESDAPPVGGAITIECARCHKTTSLTPTAALRAAFPAFHLSVGLARGESESTIGLFRRHYGSWMRCPSCGRGSWTRVTVHL